MFSFKPVLAAAAIVALAAPLAITSPSFAQGRSHGGHAHMSGGGGGGHMGMRPGGGGGGRHWAGGGGGRHWAGGGGWHGGGWRGGGFYPGFVAGSAIGLGSAFASPYYYGDSYGYYDDSPAVEVVPSGGGDDVAYCQQRYRSYDVSSGTYLGYDGLRHPCP